MKSKRYPLLLCFFILMTNLNAQDYIIDFSATGASTEVSTIEVENLTQGITRTINGNDLLHLVGVITGIEPIVADAGSNISFSPNPMKDYSRLHFVLPESGNVVITLQDISGRKMLETSDLLLEGEHSYGIHNINKGIYVVTIQSGRFSTSSRLISTGSQKSGAKIIHENSAVMHEKINETKGTNSVIEMQYTSGDRLKLTGISGDYSTIVTDIPISGKTITFDFIGCTDGDGNNYPVIKIGSSKGEAGSPDLSGDKGVQTWMGENLRSTTLNDGTAINNVTDNPAWGLLSGPAYCWYNNVINDYGALYNWYAVGTGKLCPDGWHVPDDDEWSMLVDYLGGILVAGGKLKEVGTSHWESPNQGATNESGFTALAGGWRDYSSGSFSDIRITGYFWTSTQINITNACYRCLLYNLSNVYGQIMSELDQKYGFSVRCVKDN